MKIVAVDFDGTCVEHRYPDVGETVPFAITALQQLQKNGVKIILWTMRSGEKLQDAVDWFNKNNIELWGINENPQQKKWTDSPKAYAPVYIDDAALGCPLIYANESERPYVDWISIIKLLEQKDYL